MKQLFGPVGVLPMSSSVSPMMGRRIPTRWSGSPSQLVKRPVGVCPPGTEMIRSNPLTCASKVITRMPGGGITAIA